MAPSTGSIPFGVGCAEAYDYLVAPANRPAWQSSLRAVEVLDADPVRPGLRWRDVTWPGLRPLMELTEHEPPRRWTERGAWGAVRAELTLTFEPTGGGCEVAFSFALWVSGPLRPLGPALTRLARPAVRADLRRAARLLESR